MQKQPEDVSGGMLMVPEGCDDNEPLPAGGVNYKKHRQLNNRKNVELEGEEDSEYYDEEYDDNQSGTQLAVKSHLTKKSQKI